MSGGYSDRTVIAESGGDPTAKNPRSSATGAGQFIDSTWLDQVAKYRPDLAGLPRDQILALRSDPDLSKEMVQHYGDENGAKLRAAGLPDNDGTRYLSHFAGPGGARAVLSADPSTPVVQVLQPGQVSANPFVRPMTAGQLVDWANRKIGGTAPTMQMPGASSRPAAFSLSGPTQNAGPGTSLPAGGATMQVPDADRGTDVAGLLRALTAAGASAAPPVAQAAATPPKQQEMQPLRRPAGSGFDPQRFFALLGGQSHTMSRGTPFGFGPLATFARQDDPGLSPDLLALLRQRQGATPAPDDDMPKPPGFTGFAAPATPTGAPTPVVDTSGARALGGIAADAGEGFADMERRTADLFGRIRSGEIDPGAFAKAAGAHLAGQAFETAKSAATAPRDALTGDLQVFDPATGHVSDAAMDRATGLAGLAMTGSLPFKVPAGALRTFGGRTAATADHAALDRAAAMQAGGASPDAIWRDTGWGLGREGMARFEIPDDAARVRPHDGSTTTTLGQALDHPALFEAYPGLRDVDVFHRPELGANAAANPTKNWVALNLDDPQALESLLHEGQHIVQRREGFAPGASPIDPALASHPQVAEVTALRQRLAGVDNPAAMALADRTDQAVRMNAYRTAAGEVEARNVEGRRAMSPAERAAAPPWRTQDVPNDRQWLPQSFGDAVTGDAAQMKLADELKGSRRLTFASPLSGRSRMTEQNVTELIAQRERQIADQAADPSLGAVPQILRDELSGLKDLLPKFAQDLPSGRPFAPLRPVETQGRYRVRVQEDPAYPDSRQYRAYDITAGGGYSRPRATADVSLEPDGRWRTDMLETREGHEGRGLATALYDALERDTGQKRVPSGQLLPDGYRFWSKREPEAVQFHQPFDGQFWSPRRIKNALDDPNAYATVPDKRAELQAAFDRVPPEGKTPEALALQHYAVPGAIGLGAGAAAFAQPSEAQAGETSPTLSSLRGAPPVSFGSAPFGFGPMFIPNADPEDGRRYLRRPVLDPTQAIPPGLIDAMPDTDPSMPQQQAAPALPAPEPDAPARSPLRMFGSLPPQMFAPAGPEESSGPLPSLVGSQTPVMPTRAPIAAAEDAPAAPAPARPLTFGQIPVSAPAPAAPSPLPATTGSLAPPTGSPAAPSPAGPAGPAAAAEPSFLDRVGSGLRDVATDRDLLMNLGIGLMSTPGWGQGAAAGLKGYQDAAPRRAATKLAEAEYGLKAQKVQQEQLGNNATVAALIRGGYSQQDALGLVQASIAGHREGLQNALNNLYPKKEIPSGFTLDPSGTAVPIPGGPQDLATIKAQAEARQEDKTVSPLTDPTARLKAGIAQNDTRQAWIDPNGKVTFDQGETPRLITVKGANGETVTKRFNPATGQAEDIPGAAPPGVDTTGVPAGVDPATFRKEAAKAVVAEQKGATQRALQANTAMPIIDRAERAYQALAEAKAIGPYQASGFNRAIGGMLGANVEVQRQEYEAAAKELELMKAQIQMKGQGSITEGERRILGMTLPRLDAASPETGLTTLRGLREQFSKAADAEGLPGRQGAAQGRGQTTGAAIPIPGPAVQALQRDPNLREQFEAKYGQGSAGRFLGGR